MARQRIITIGRGTYLLDPVADVRSLKDAVERAVQDGGAFVSIPLALGAALDVLITPGLLVSIESSTTVELRPYPEANQRVSSALEDFSEY
ncbi:hypothetical protein KXS11_11715 [Plantibacter flavus]|uniref:hypothetical protein n=1 Tax=Plantibacter flavus TaxID=150123 RepID=UPI003F1899AB